METTVSTLIAAMVLKAGREEIHRPLTWNEIGNIFGIAGDVLRKRVKRFMDKNSLSFDAVKEDTFLGVISNWDEFKNCKALPGFYFFDEDAFGFSVFTGFNEDGSSRFVEFDYDSYKNEQTYEVKDEYLDFGNDEPNESLVELMSNQESDNVISAFEADSSVLPDLTITPEGNNYYYQEYEKQIQQSKVTKGGQDSKPNESSIQNVFDVGIIEGFNHPFTMRIETVPAPAPEIQSLITENALVVVRDGKPQTIDKSHKNFEKIKDALESKNYGVVFDLMDLKGSIEKYSNGRVTIEDGSVCLDGEQVHGKLVERMLSVMMDGETETLDALAQFMQKCDENPDNRVVTRIYDFIQATDIRLAEDGDILCYKIVRNDYKDKYTGTFDNSPSSVVKMKRNLVDPREEYDCKSGLHLCSRSYLDDGKYGGSGDKVLLCKLNPVNIVSVPQFYKANKLRCCEYEVLKDVSSDFDDVVGIKA